MKVGNATCDHNAFKLAPELRDGVEFFTHTDALFDFTIQHVAVAQNRLDSLYDPGLPGEQNN